MTIQLSDYKLVPTELMTLAGDWLDPSGATQAMLAFSDGKPSNCYTLIDEIQAAIKYAAQTSAKTDVPRLREIEHLARNSIKQHRVRARIDSAVSVAMEVGTSLDELHRWLDQSYSEQCSTRPVRKPVDGQEQEKVRGQLAMPEAAQEAA